MNGNEGRLRHVHAVAKKRKVCYDNTEVQNFGFGIVEKNKRIVFLGVARGSVGACFARIIVGLAYTFVGLAPKAEEQPKKETKSTEVPKNNQKENKK